MKNILVLCLIFASISCKENLTEHPSIRRIVNGTEVNVRVEVFGDDQKFIYNIIAGDSFDIEGICTSGIETYCDLGWVTSLANGRIFFGNEKVQVFGYPSGNNYEKFINADPISGGYGYVRSNENGIDIYTYRITPEDYDMAEDCDGGCD
ncbi:hypothetical protein [Saccharicrinis carchari]|nr:hypothetical protein [Saccharicrinis carchari]